MKKIVLLFCIVASVLTVQAQKEKGFGGKAEIGYGLGFGSSYNTFNVNLMPGYHFSPRWFAGVGVGYQNVNVNSSSFYNSSSLSLIPVFAHGQWNMTAGKKVTPFLGAKLGYAIGSKTYDVGVVGTTEPVYYKMQGQVMWGLDVGVKYSLGCSSIYASIYYEYTDMKASANVQSVELIGVVGTNENAGLRLGWEF